MASSSFYGIQAEVEHLNAGLREMAVAGKKKLRGRLKQKTQA